MGASTVAQLIARGKAENGYNNSGISNDPQWIDFFNDALRDLVEDLNIVDLLSLVYTAGTREVDLPSDFFAMVELYDANQCRVLSRDTYYQQYPSGFFIMYRGSKYVIDLYNYTSSQTFSGLYQRYAATLAATSDTPEIPSIAEKALPFYAIAKALKNNNQLAEAAAYDSLYQAERKKLRTATARSRGY
jgi:hypothetical protein